MNPLEIGLSFIEGLALIVSPCILPVLPLVLGASVDGGRKRPFGIIIGFVLAFSLFAIAARHLVAALGIDVELIKHVSLVLLFALGLVLVSSTLSAKFSSLTHGAANFGTRVAIGGKDGLLSGIAIGALIGFVWTPCAGPILASVLVQVIRQESNLAGYFIIFAFAIGAGLPMLVIALTGRKIMSKLGFFTKHAENIRKVFGALIIGSVIFIASGVDAAGFFSSNKTAPVTLSQEGLQDGLATPYAAPEFAGIQAWLNSNPLTMASLRGKVVLIDFWTYSCINCVRTLPHITKWDAQYRDKGLVIIGVHAPEFEFEKNAENVKAAAMQHHIHYPVALDNKLDTWTNFQNRYWPAHYLINQQGQVVYTHFGEGNYDVTEHNIRELLGLREATVSSKNDNAISNANQTPETYLGYSRAENFSSEQPVKKDEESHYTLPSTLPLHHWALQGEWNIGSENITSAGNGAKLRLHFNAKKVFLVLGTKDGKPVHAKILLNGTPIGERAGSDLKKGILTVDHHSLYELVNQTEAKEGALEIEAEAANLEAYAFTFGN